MPPLHNRACFESYMGLWAYEPQRLQAAANAIRAGRLEARAREEKPSVYEELGVQMAGPVAVVPLMGSLMKGWSKYGGTSTVAARQAMRQLETDKQARAVVLHIDSPGGTVAGTAELAASIERLGRAKPVVAHIDDLGASAAYWIANAAQSIAVNAMGLVGSIGVYGVVEDWSKAYEEAGVKVHVVSTGPYKGAGVEGTPVTKEQLAEVQKTVDAMHQGFLAQVQTGRKNRMSREQIEQHADGRMFGAADAKAAGLVDYVQSMDDTIQQAAALVAAMDRASRLRNARLADV